MERQLLCVYEFSSGDRLEFHETGKALGEQELIQAFLNLLLHLRRMQASNPEKAMLEDKLYEARDWLDARRKDNGRI